MTQHTPRALLVLLSIATLACSDADTDPVPSPDPDTAQPDAGDTGDPDVPDTPADVEDVPDTVVPDVPPVEEVDAAIPDDGPPIEDTGPPPVDTGPPLYCQPDSKRCLTELIAQTCVSAGTHWTDTICQEDERCFDGECGPIVCEPGELGDNCASPTGWGICNSVGTGYVPVECPDDQSCYLGICVGYVCEPESLACWGMTAIQQCNIDGSAWEVTESCEPGGLCQDAQCQSACDVAAAAQRNVGCEFVAISPDIRDKDGNGGDTALIVSSAGDSNDSEITIVNLLTGEPLGDPVLLDAGNAEVFLLPAGAQLDGSGVSELSWKITSTAPIAVQQATPWDPENPAPHDASLLVPVADHAREFLIPAWQVQTDGVNTRTPWITVVATSPGTTHIEFVPRADIAPGPLGSVVIDVLAGQQVPYELEQGFVLQIESKAVAGQDLTGSWLLADKPIAVFAGHECARIPNELVDCGQLQEQVPPVSGWGDTVVAVPFSKRTETQFDVWRIMAGAEGVIVQTNPPVPGYDKVTLQKGGFVTVSSETPFVIKANGPILVSHLIVGAIYPGSDQTACDGKGTGDPALTLDAPTAQYVRRALINPVPGLLDYYIDIVQPTGTVVTLDGVAITSPATPIGTSGWAVQQVAMPAGAHVVEGSQKIGVTTYAYGCSASYANPGAVRTRDLSKTAAAYVIPAVTPPPKPPVVGFPTDEDEDEILSDVDNCPSDYNPEQTDTDGDGWGDECDADIDGDGAPNDIDCAAHNPAISPLTQEVCDGADNDCDKDIDETDSLGCTNYFVDQDGDGAGAANFSLCLCAPSSPYTVLFGGDCVDGNSFVTPASAE